jgi:hypothetical protein
MIEINVDLDLVKLRKYHPEAELWASFKTHQNQPIDLLTQSLQIDYTPNNMDSKEEFLQLYGDLLTEYDLLDYAGDILYLSYKITTDINISLEITTDFQEAIEILKVLIELFRMKEKSNEPITLEFKRKSPKGKVILDNQRLVDYLTTKLISISRSPSFNTQLSSLLEGIELTRANLTRVLLGLKYRASDPSGYCRGIGCVRLLNYINSETRFKTPNGSLISNLQARFLFDLLYLQKITPPDKHQQSFKEDYIRSLVRHHKRFQIV